MQMHCVYRSSIRKEGTGCLVKEDQTIANVQYRAILHISNSMMQRIAIPGILPIWHSRRDGEAVAVWKKIKQRGHDSRSDLLFHSPLVGWIVGNLVNCFDTYWWGFNICWPQALLHFYFLSYLKAHWGPHWGYRVFKSIYVILVPVNRKE